MQGFQDKVAAAVRSHSDEFEGPPPPGSAYRPDTKLGAPSPAAERSRRRVSAFRRAIGRAQIYHCHFDGGTVW